MAILIGPTFPSELAAAGVSLEGIAWNLVTGVIICSDATQLAAAETVLAAHDPTKQLVVVPSMVSNYQARTVLIQRGLFAKADAALRGADQTVAANQMAVQAWDYANDFYRDSDFVASIGQALGLTSAEIDQLFIAANAVR